MEPNVGVRKFLECNERMHFGRYQTHRRHTCTPVYVVHIMSTCDKYCVRTICQNNLPITLNKLTNRRTNGQNNFLFLLAPMQRGVMNTTTTSHISQGSKTAREIIMLRIGPAPDHLPGLKEAVVHSACVSVPNDNNVLGCNTSRLL